MPTTPLPRLAGVVVAGGSGTRVGVDRNKVLLPLAGRPVLQWSVQALGAAVAVARLVRLVVVARATDVDAVRSVLRRCQLDCPVTITIGGRMRHDSEYRALCELAADIDAAAIDLVAIHDAARPLASPPLVQAVVAAAARDGGAVPGIPVADLVLRTGAGMAPLPDGAYVRMQTPQVFAAAPLLAAYRAASAAGFTGTDTASCVQAYTDTPVRCVPGDPDNLKITVAADFEIAADILADRHRHDSARGRSARGRSAQVTAEPVQDRLEPGDAVARQPRP